MTTTAEFGFASDLTEAAPETPDMVNHPPHYNSHPAGIECIEVIEHAQHYNLAAAMKYLWRVTFGGKWDDYEDLKKAIWYIEREIALREQPTAPDTTPSFAPLPEVSEEEIVAFREQMNAWSAQCALYALPETHVYNIVVGESDPAVATWELALGRTAGDVGCPKAEPRDSLAVGDRVDQVWQLDNAEVGTVIRLAGSVSTVATKKRMNGGGVHWFLASTTPGPDDEWVLRRLSEGEVWEVIALPASN